MDFPRFLEQKYLEWQQKEGGRKTVGQFAKYLGVGQSTVSMWWNGVNTPRDDKIDILAIKLGPEVYDALGLERPDPDLAFIDRHWERFSPEFRKSLREQAEQYVTENEVQRVPKPRTQDGSV